MANDKTAAGKKTIDKDAPKGADKDALKTPGADASPPIEGATPPPSDTPPPTENAAPPASDASGTHGEAPPAGGVEIGARPIRKINPKDVMEKKMKEVEVPEKGIYDLFTIIGTAANLRDGESQFGPWTSLVGEFEATRLVDGQRFISTECFVPGAAGDLLVTQVRKFVIEEIPVTAEQYKKTGKTYKVTGETAEMALIVGIKKAQRDGGADYEYVIRPVVPVQKSDPLATLRNQLKSALAGGALTLSLPPPKPASPVAQLSAPATPPAA